MANAMSTLFGLPDVIPYDDRDSKLYEYAKIIMFFIPVYVVLTFIFKKKEIIALEYDKVKMKRGYTWLIVCAVLSFLFLLISTFWKDISYMYLLKHR